MIATGGSYNTMEKMITRKTYHDEPEVLLGCSFRKNCQL